MEEIRQKNRIKHAAVMTAVMILIVIAAAAELMLTVDKSYAAEGYEDVASSSEMASALTVGKYGMVPIHESDVKPGTYHVTTESSSSFFHIVDTKLTVKKDKMVAVIQIASYSYKCVYMGTGEEAAKADLKDYIMAEESDLGTSFTIPIEALNKEIPLAAFSKKKKKWYDRLILVDASTLPASAVSFTVPDYSRIESAIELYDQENKTNTREELEKRATKAKQKAKTGDESDGATEPADIDIAASGEIFVPLAPVAGYVSLWVVVQTALVAASLEGIHVVVELHPFPASAIVVLVPDE